MPLVSVIVPCYNHEDYIFDCISGLLRQTYPNIELIIIDDSSTDNSYSIVETYRQKLEEKFYKVIIKQHKNNRGTAYTLNEMIGLSCGKYIETTASDDILCSNAVENFVRICEKNDRCSLAYSNFYLIDEKEHFPINDYSKFELGYRRNQPSGEGLTQLLLLGNFVSGATSFFPRSTIENIGEFDEKSYCEDWDFNIRASIKGNIIFVQEPLVLCRVTPNSKCRHDMAHAKEKNQLLHNDAVYIFNKYKKYADDNVSSRFFSNQLALAVGVDDWKLANDIRKIMKNEKYNLILPFKDKVYIDIVLSPLGKTLRKR